MKRNLYLLLAVLLCGHIAQAQIITTFAGTGVSGNTGDGGLATAAQLAGPFGVALDGGGNVYIESGDIVRKVNTAGIITTVAGTTTSGFSGDGGPATAAQFNGISGIAISPSGELFIADRFNNRVRVVNTSGIVRTFAGTGAYTTTGDGGPATAATLGWPAHMSFDVFGNVYIADEGGERIRKVDATGIISTIAGASPGMGIGGYSGDGGPATAALFNAPTALSSDAVGNVYVADYYNSCIRKISTSGIITTVAGTGVAGYSGDGGPATAAQLQNVWGVTVDGTGNLYISDIMNHAVRMVNTSGIISTIAGDGVAGYTGDGGAATASRLHSPSMVSLDASGSIYIADGGNNVIRHICSAGAATPISGASAVCTGSTITLTDGTTGGLWSSSATTIASADASTGVVTGLSAGTAIISYSISGTCGTATATKTITVNSAPIAGTISGPSVVCVRDSVTLTSTETGGVWSRSNTRARVSPVGLVTGLRAGVDTIRYTVTNACGTAVATHVVTVNPLPNAGNITGPASVCTGATIIQTDSVAGGTWMFTNMLATVTPGSYTGIVTAGAVAGRDTLFYIVSNSCGYDTVGRIITVRNLPAPISGPWQLCQGDSVSFHDADTAGTWRSSNFAVAIFIPTTSIVFAITPGTSTISYGSPGCAVTHILTVNPLPAVHTLTGGGHFCQGSAGAPVMLNGSNTGIEYQLIANSILAGSPVAGTGAVLDFGPQAIAGVYTAVGTNPLTGCTRNMTGRDTLILDSLYTPSLTITARPGLSIFNGQKDTLKANTINAGPAAAYQWMINSTYIGGATSSTYIYNGFADGDSVTCFVTSNSSCGGSTVSRHVIIHVQDNGVNELAGNGSFTVFPNPNNGKFTVNLNALTASQATITVTNLLGEKVKEMTIHANKATDVQINAVPGIYFVTARSDSGRYTTKIVVE